MNYQKSFGLLLSLALLTQTDIAYSGKSSSGSTSGGSSGGSDYEENGSSSSGRPALSQSRVHFKKPSDGAHIVGPYTIHLTKARIRRTIGQDIGSVEEGVILLNFGDQETSLNWHARTERRSRKKKWIRRVRKGFSFPPKDVCDNAGNLTKNPEREELLVYLGSDSHLQMSVSVDERDDKEKISRGMDTLTKLGGFAAFAGPYQAPVTQGLSVFTSLGKFIATFIHDTQELKFHSTLCQDKPREGDYKLYVGNTSEDDNPRDADIYFRFSVRKVKNYFPDNELGLKEAQIRVILQGLSWTPSLARRISRTKGEATLAIVAGGTPFKTSFQANAMKDDVLCLDDVLLYEGKWKGALPISASLCATSIDVGKQLEAGFAVIETLKELIPSSKTKDSTFIVYDTVSSALTAALIPPGKLEAFSLGRKLIDGDGSWDENGEGSLKMHVYSKEKIIGDLFLRLKIEPSATEPSATALEAAEAAFSDAQAALSEAERVHKAVKDAGATAENPEIIRKTAFIATRDDVETAEAVVAEAQAAVTAAAADEFAADAAAPAEAGAGAGVGAGDTISKA